MISLAQTLTNTEIKATFQQAFELNKAERYSEALDAFLIVGENTKHLLTELDREMYVISQIMASSCYFRQKEYNAGYQLAKQFIAGEFTDSEKQEMYHQYVLNGYFLAGKLLKHDEQGYAEYKNARDLLHEVEPYASGQLKERVLDMIPYTWYFEGIQHFIAQRFDEAILCFRSALSGFQNLGSTSDVISSLKHIASAEYHTYNIAAAIDNYEQALLLSEQISDKAEMLVIANELFRLSNIIGDMETVSVYTNLMDSIIANTTDDNVLFDYYSNKGDEAQSHGRFNIAEQWFLKAKSIVEGLEPSTINSEKHLAYLNLRDLYVATKQYDAALEYAQLTIEELKGISNSSFEEFYLSYISLAEIYCRKNDKENCFKCLDSIFMIEPRLDEPRDLKQLYAIRGMCHNYFGDYQSALADYKKADEIMAAKYPSTDGGRAVLYSMMGAIEHKLGHYQESEHYYRIYAETIKGIYGEKSLDYFNALIYLANAEGFAGNIDDGCRNYTSAVLQLKSVIKARLPYMNTAEREGLWSTLSSQLTNMTPYALKAGLHQTEYTETCYDALLLSKAFLLDSERSVYDLVQREGDEADMHTYMSVASMNNRIKEWERNYSIYADSILATSNMVSRLESMLMKRCKSFGDVTSFIDVNYRTVKAALKKNEYVIDFTDFVSETSGRRYAAYLVDKKQKYPLLKPLFAESQIDSLGITYPDMYYDEEFAPNVVKLLWEPFKEYITEGATVYYIPSQLIFQISLESLPLADGTLLGEHYNFVRLSSARELIKRKNADKKQFSSAVLYGGLQYDLELEMMAESAKRYDLSSLMVMRGGGYVRGDSAFCELPGTKKEIDNIAEILDRSKVEVTQYVGVEGTEESFLNMHGKSPQILHIATHGFYYTPDDAVEIDYLKGYSDAMSLSGLILSGGNAAWRGKELPKGVLGGVLTANNIARLDLSNTDMVVLSACKSGLGNATAEGLYGLQRAFKKAGVTTIVMTLWSVSDRVTQEFMIEFYECLVANDWNKHKAFEQAMSYIRTKYPDPYHWAAFVMLD